MTAHETQAWIPLASTLFVAAIGVRLLCYTGLIGSDDIWYQVFARSFANGDFSLTSHHFAVRPGVLLPVAAVFRVFGIHEWSVVVVPLVASSVAVVFTALIALRLAGPTAAWAAGLLMATLPVAVRYSSVLVPEPILQAFVLAGALLFLKGEHRRSDLLVAGAGAFLAMAYLTKETGAFVAVAFFTFAVVRREWRLAFAFAAGVALLLISEALWYWSQSGDPLFRFNSLAAHNESEGAASANTLLPWRLFKAYPGMMIIPNIHMGLHSVTALLLAAAALLRRRLRGTSLLLMLWALVPFLYLNFGSTSLDRYWVIPASPRYIELIYPPLFILSAITLAELLRTRWRPVVTVALAAVCSVGIICAAGSSETGHNTAHVKRLKEFVVAARRDDVRVCEFEGRHATEWRIVLRIVAPDLIGCGATSVRLAPDAEGLPTPQAAPASSPSSP